MCLIAFAIGAHARCPLLLAANRDEFFDRPTAALRRWTSPNGTVVLAGQDLRDGGTWLGVSEAGHVAMLTNVRSRAPGPGPRSRGGLPMQWLQGDLTLDDLPSQIDPGAYAGFNMVAGDLRNHVWAWISNCHPEHPHQEQGRSLHLRHLSPGIYGLSNASLDTPWPKTLRLKAAVGESLRSLEPSEDETAWMQPLMRVLSDPSITDDDALPHTGVAVALERQLSSPFVSLAERGYGTRSSALMRATSTPEPGGDTGWQLEMHEWVHEPEAASASHRWNTSSARRETLSW